MMNSWWLLAALMVAAPAMAQTSLADPTRPPAGSSVAETLDTGSAVGPVLQSVVLPKKGKATAVIGGQQVRLGERYGESRLIKLSEKEAVLEGPAGVEHLMLTPGIEKINITTKNPTKKINKAPAKTTTQGGSKP